jgi:hypothetical protein
LCSYNLCFYRCTTCEEEEKKIKAEDHINDVETTEHEEEHKKKKKKKKVKNEHLENESVAYGEKFTDFPFH